MKRHEKLNLTVEEYAEYLRCYKIAREYFKLQKGWVLHHKDPTLKKNDYKRYCEWRLEDLVPMTISDHIALHNSLRDRTESNKKTSNTLKGGHWVYDENGKKTYVKRRTTD